MKHLKEKAKSYFDEQTIALIIVGIIYFILLWGLFSFIDFVTTDGAKEDKSVNEQVCLQETNYTAVEGSATLMARSLEEIEEVSDETETVGQGVIEEQTKEKEYVHGWLTTNVNVREAPSTDAKVLELYPYNTEVEYTGYNDEWVEIKYNDDIAFLTADYISNEKNPEIVIQVKTPEAKSSNNSTVVTNSEPVATTNPAPASSGSTLTRSSGVCYGPSGRETYYNLPMDGCIYYMQQLGYNYSYWVRNDGCKMYGDYIMIAANTNAYPKGTILPTSLGMGMVCDHCEAAAWGISSIDIATTW